MKKTKTTRGPRGYTNAYTLAATAETTNGYFAVTGDIYHTATRSRGHDGTRECGCIHDQIVRRFPKLKPLIALHLCDVKTGEPMHAEANGYYWLAGTFGDGLNEEYHGGSGSSGKSIDECLRIFAEQYRVPIEEAQAIHDRIAAVTAGPDQLINDARKAEFRKVYEECLPRWQAEANAGLELLANW